MSYQDDSIEKVYNEISKLEAEIMTASSSLKPLGDKEAEAGANYEDKKNRYLIELFSREDGFYPVGETDWFKFVDFRNNFTVPSLDISIQEL